MGERAELPNDGGKTVSMDYNAVDNGNNELVSEFDPVLLNTLPPPTYDTAMEH